MYLFICIVSKCTSGKWLFPTRAPVPSIFKWSAPVSVKLSWYVQSHISFSAITIIHDERRVNALLNFDDDKSVLTWRENNCYRFVIFWKYTVHSLKSYTLLLLHQVKRRQYCNNMVIIMALNCDVAFAVHVLTIITD